MITLARFPMIGIGMGLLSLAPSVFVAGQQPLPAKELLNPTGIQIYFLQNMVAKTEPPYRELAKLDDRYRAANEFEKQSALNLAEKELRATASQVPAGVKFLRINLNATFGEYDFRYKEYDFRMDDGAAISFQAFQKPIRVVMTNGGLARSWPLTPDQAQDVLSRNAGRRNVILALRLSISTDDSLPMTNGNSLVLNTRIVDYDVLGRDGIKLGHVEVK